MPLYDDLRSDMLSGIKVLQVGPVYYADLVGTQANFRRFNRCLAALLRFGPYDLDVGGAMGGGGTVPIYYLAKPQPRERAWENQRGKKTLLSLTLVWHCKET
ncbi:hypothetical protein EVAR_47569_1 [Eumeta japonica]|uniref:Uncharacterized protein n=1 Tax=Eumeta variegata TaxID=151549 RepID=A0A4C1WS23_EUMVA|nr:hypothetical protein EVAR_47569_1 [Eumeta japonica]